MLYFVLSYTNTNRRVIYQSARQPCRYWLLRLGKRCIKAAQSTKLTYLISSSCDIGGPWSVVSYLVCSSRLKRHCTSFKLHVALCLFDTNRPSHSSLFPTHSLTGGRAARCRPSTPPRLPSLASSLLPPLSAPALPSCLLPSLSVGHKRPVCPRDVAPAAPASASPSVRMSVGGRECEGENSALCDGRHVTILI